MSWACHNFFGYKHFTLITVIYDLFKLVEKISDCRKKNF